MAQASAAFTDSDVLGESRSTVSHEAHRLYLLRFKGIWKAIALSLVSYLCCVLLLAGSTHALDPNKRVTQYMHTSWRTQDGSLPAGMFSITQTPDGFLWVLSLPGDIYRFDGIRFELWPLPGDFGKGPAGKVFSEGTDGLWVAGNELIYLKGRAVISHFKLDGIHAFQSLAQAPDGSLWVGLRGSDEPLCHVKDSAVKCFGKDDGIPTPTVSSVLADGPGSFWLAGETALVHWQQGSVSETYPINLLITSLARGPDGTLWLGADKGLLQLKQGALKPFVTPSFDGSTISVTDLEFDRDGNLWVASDAKGLFRIHGNTVNHYGHTEGLSGDSVWALFEDREGIVWAGTTSGIDSFRDPRVTTFSVVEGLGKDLAAGILATRDGSIWVANSGSLDRIKNGSVSSINKSNGLPGGQVAAMLEDRADNMWVGVDDGLYLFKEGRFRRVPEPDHKPLGMVVGLTEDTDGNVWAECASKPRKLIRIRDFQVREVFFDSQIPPGHNLASDPKGGIWIETRKGDIALFRNGRVETTIPLPRTGSPLNRQILAQADGSVLVGTENGLVGWQPGKVQRMTTKNGLPCDFVIAFIQDTEKRWWLYTRCGVVEFSDSELQRWWANPDTIVNNRVYDAFDGAQPNIGSFNAAARTSDGRVWFSTGVVVQVVDPSKLSQNVLTTRAYIEAVIADRKELPISDKLRLSPHARDLQIDYTSPSFSIPRKVKFRYRLDGYDRDWHDAGTRRQAFYTDLPPGNYKFRVVASNNDGVWDDRATELGVSIAPAYYQTNWFRALCAAILIGLLCRAYQLRVRRLHQQFALTLDARVGERTRIARELHDTLLQSAHGLLLRFQTVSQLLPDRADQAKEYLDGAIEQTAKFITEARDEVQGLRASTLEMNDLPRAISTLGQELASDSNKDASVDFNVTVEGTARNLIPIIRDEIYKITAEALRNVFKHAQAERVEVEIRYANDQFRLRVRDDGRGIDSSILSGNGSNGHYGLPGMRERATVIGGKLAVWSEVDAGTEVELCVPGSTAYVRARKRSWFSRGLAASAEGASV
jgi:signal transduction histidine kinase/ligand-binding sensor domain-containing protein